MRNSWPLITQEMKDGKEQPDAVIIAGPKVSVEGGLPPGIL